MKAYGGVAVRLHEFLTLETDGGVLATLTPGNKLRVTTG
jgi:hypothetical protein